MKNAVDALKNAVTSKLTDVTTTSKPAWKSLEDAFSNTGNLTEIASGLVLLTEAATEEVSQDPNVVVAGKDKQQAVVQILESWIKLPVFLEWLDDLVLPWLVNLVVGRYNEKSKNWGPAQQLIAAGCKAILEGFASRK